MKTLQQAISAGMYHSYTHCCPECGCDWYGNKNLLGEGSRECFNCGQEYWLDVKYTNPAERKELE